MSLVDCHVSYVAATTVEGYTQREVECAARARKLYHYLSAKNIQNVKVWLRYNQCKNVPILVEDVNLTEKIYKTEVAAWKGKSVRPHPPVVTTNEIVELPTELMTKGRQIELAIDILYINNEAFLHSVDKTLRYNGIISLGTKVKGEMYTAETLCKASEDILCLYNRADIYIKRIHCDNDFKTVFRELDKNCDAEFNYSSPQKHVPDIEHKNRVLREQFVSEYTVYRSRCYRKQ